MGSSHSSPSGASTPAASPSIESTRPATCRRLSSFGRPSIRSQRKSSHRTVTRSHRDEGAVKASIGGEAGQVRLEQASSEGDLGRATVLDEGVGIAESASRPIASDTTISHPTTPGPPVPFATPGPAGSSSLSYFPLATPSSSTQAPHQPTPVSPSVSRSAADNARPASAGPSLAHSTSPARPLHHRQLSLPNPPSASDRVLSGRLTALLGFSAPSEATDPEPVDAPASNDALASSAVPDAPVDQRPLTTDNDTDSVESDDPSNLAELQERLDNARRELEASQAELASLQEGQSQRRLAREAGGGAARVPIGAMLVIQGLAQTQVTTSSHAEASAEEEAPGSGAQTGGISASPGATTGSGAAGSRPSINRRISDGSLFRRRRETERDQGASLEQQARMISGLLTVATAATANTLLSTPEPPATPAPRSGLSGAIQSLLDRLRPSRTPRHGIEQALGQYLRNVVRDRNRTQSTESLILPPINLDAAIEFQAFLQGLQGDLVNAVRTYAGSVDTMDESLGGTSGESTLPETPGSEVAPVCPEGQALEPTPEGNDAAVGSGTAEAPGSPSITPVSAVPTFHHQLGQNLPGSEADRFGVRRGRNGRGRSLNFFRAHIFPPMPNDPTAPPAASPADASIAAPIATPTSAAAATTTTPVSPGGDADADAIVPCIFVGVISIQHDPNSTPEDLFNQPGLFEGAAGPGPAESAAGSFTPATAATDTATLPPTPLTASTLPPSPLSPPTTASTLASGSSGADSSSSSRPSLPRMVSSPPPIPRSFRDRFLNRLSRRASPPQPTNTYLIYVIGGNYPRNHPVLRIPNLITGGPLTDEDMALITELMGPAKPATATKDDIDNAGLRLVDGADMAELGRKGDVLDNSTERCLICLSDYEAGEECRVLSCKHGYHKECVDQWLEKGSNSCPACRTEAVDKTKAPAASPDAAARQPTDTVVSALTPSSGVEAGPSGSNRWDDAD